jgi:hypothetical protein
MWAGQAYVRRGLCHGLLAQRATCAICRRDRTLRRRTPDRPRRRPHAVPVTIFSTLCFYAYSALTMLPPVGHASAPAPEVSGCREWPFFRERLMRRAWGVAFDYLKLKVRNGCQGHAPRSEW